MEGMRQYCKEFIQVNFLMRMASLSPGPVE